MSREVCKVKIYKIENKERYDLILLDIMMPKMGGVETLRRLKQVEGFNTPVIALTADAIQGKKNKYLEVGFNSYLSKPIDKEKLENFFIALPTFNEQDRIVNKINSLEPWLEKYDKLENQLTKLENEITDK